MILKALAEQDGNQGDLKGLPEIKQIEMKAKEIQEVVGIRCSITLGSTKVQLKTF